MKKLLLFALALTMVGCATQYRVRVTQHHTFQQKPEEAFTLNKTFDVLPLDKRKKGSLGFEAKAKMIADKLERHGMRREKLTPELLVFLDYSIGSGKTKFDSYPVYGQTGGGTRTRISGSTYGSGGNNRFSGTARTAPTYGVTGYDSYSYTEYKRRLLIDIVDTKTSKGDEVKKIYEARVVSVGSSGVIDVVVPYMIEAVFKDFPGKSGATEKYDLSKKDLEDKEEK